jgi:ribosomal protein L13E
LSKPQKKKLKAKEGVEKVEEAGKGAVREAARAEKAIRREIEGLRRPHREAEAKPSGRVPFALVTSRHGIGTVSRHGKGFSLGELSEAGFEPNLATKWGVWVDHRRRSTLQENVNSLKGWHTRHGPTARIEFEAKEVEVDLEKVGREVVKVPAEAKKEIVKVQRAARKAPKKVGKAVKARVAKTKPKRKKSKS